MDIAKIHAINQTPYMLFAAITGGGVSFLGDYLTVSGASKTIVGAFVPYHQAMFDQFLKGARVDSYASEEAARKLAVNAYNECLKAKISHHNAMGLGVACSLVKDNEREGREHRIHIALHSAERTVALNVLLVQGRTRQEEESLTKKLIFDVLCKEILGNKDISPLPLLKGESFFFNEAGNSTLANLVAGFDDWVNNLPFSKQLPGVPLAIYCGSWNPWHDGHQQIYDLSEEILDTIPALELSVVNADKGQLDFIDISNRITSISKKPYILTAAPTFVQKAELLRKKFPHRDITFIVGTDTWKRIWDAKYAGDPESVEHFFAQNRIKFLVFGRDGSHVEIYDKNGYEYGGKLRIKDPRAEKFTSPISSTAIRKEQLKHA